MRSDDRSPHARYGHVVPKRVVKRLRLFLQLPLQLGRLGPSRSLPPLPPTLQRGPRLRKCRVSGGGGDFRLLQGKLAGSLLHRTLPQLALCLLLCTLCLLQSRLRPFQLEECVGHRRRRLLGLLPLLLLLLLLLPLRERHRVANACWCFCHCSCWLGLQLGRWLKCWPCCWLSCLPGELWGGLHFRGRLLAVGRPNAAAAAAGGGGRRKTAARCCRRRCIRACRVLPAHQHLLGVCRGGGCCSRQRRQRGHLGRRSRRTRPSCAVGDRVVALVR
jgi:hypothetical protein